MAQVPVILVALPSAMLLLSAASHRAACARMAALYSAAVRAAVFVRIAVMTGIRAGPSSLAGGRVGASTLYHLAKIGWTDVG